VTPYVGQLLLVGFNFAPVNWLLCNGSLQSIAENQALFTLIGTTYGGDGQNTFGIPDLQGRLTVHQGTNLGTTVVLGQKSGVESVNLSTQTIPAHTHPWTANSSTGTANNPTGVVLAGGGQNKVYSDQPPGAPMIPGMISQMGGNLPHNNLQPFLVCNWIIAQFGIFPTQN
jgi:microcystin-dependent protein